MNAFKTLPFIALAALLTACAANADTSTQPTAPDANPVVSSVRIDTTAGSVPGDATMLEGDAATLHAVARDASGFAISGVALSWASSNTRIATVDPNTGQVRAISSGPVTIYAWATGRDGGPVSDSVKLSVAIPFKSIVAAGNLTCGVSKTIELYCWGFDSGASFVSGTSARPVATGQHWSIISLGGGSLDEAHLCGVDAGGTARCTGQNGWGQLGIGTTRSIVLGEATTPIVGPTFSTLVAGEAHTCGLTSGGDLYCWGINGPPLAGIPTPCEYATVRAACELTPVKLAAGTTFKALNTSSSQTCAIATAGHIYCWLPGQTPSLVTPLQSHSFVALASGGQSPQSDLFVCGLTADGSIYCSGANNHYQLGAKSVALDGESRLAGGPYTAVAAGGNHACALTQAGDAYCWGSNIFYESAPTQAEECPVAGTGTCVSFPTLVQGGQRFVSLAIAGYHNCGLTASGEAYCWGRGSMGALGIGFGPYTLDATSLDPVRIPRPVGYAWKETY